MFALVIASWASGAYYDQFSYELTGVSDQVWAWSFLAFPLVGLFLAIRIPSNAVGWLFLVGPGLVGAGVSASEYGESIDSSAFQEYSDTLLFAGLIGMVASILLFPNGRYPNRWFMGVHMGLLLGLAVSVAMLEEDSPMTPVLLIALIALTLAALGYRVLRGDATVRRQIVGPVLVVFVGLVAMVVATTLIPDGAVGGWRVVIPFILLTMGVPVSIGFSITRYRLYEIDRIVSRTVSYSLVVGVLVAAVVVVSTLAGSQFDAPWVVATTTLGVAALFNPLRKRIQAVVDRRFNRSMYDAERVADAFAGSLRDRVDPDGVVDGWVGVVSETLQPAAMGVWLRDSE
jgi:hypothetical protein